MKKIITLQLVLVSVLLAQGQTANDKNKNQILYDYGAGIPPGRMIPVQQGEFATFKITNVNTFLYKVDIKGKNINYVTPVPTELQTLFRLPEEKGYAESTEEALAEIEKPATEMKALAALATSEVSKSEEALRKAKNVFTAAHSLLKEENRGSQRQVEALLKDQQEAEAELEASKEFEEAMKALSIACERYLNVAKKIANIKLTRVELIDAGKHDWKSYEEMNAHLPARLSEKGMKEDYLDFTQYYARADVLYTKAKDAAQNSSDPEANAKKVEEAHKQIMEGYGRIKEEDFLGIIRDVSILQQNMFDPNSFTVVSPPVQMDGDYVYFEVSSTPVQTEAPENHITEKKFFFEVPTKGGWKADFSVGPAFSVGRNASDDRYYLQAGDSTSVLVKSTNRSVVFPAVVAMLHAYKRSGTQVNWGIMMGVGAGFKSTTDITASYYLGPTVVLGKQQKLMFSAGVSFLPVERLKNNYNTSSTYVTSKIDVNSIMEKTILSSFFFSVSYNLTNRTEVK